MYFGSVKFFKHFIVTVLILAIVIPITISLILSSRLKDKDIEIENLVSKKNAVQTLLNIRDDVFEYTAEEFYNLLNSLGINDRELIMLLYQHDKEAFKTVLDGYGVSVEAIANAIVPDKTVISAQTAETTTEPVVSDTSAVPETTTETTTEPPVTEEPKPDYESLYPDLYCETAENPEYTDDEGFVYLTYDDGPSVYTSSILYYLKQYDLRATFFVIPDDTENCKNYLNTMIKDGHTIGIHSATHDYNKIYNSVEAYLDDFYTAYKMIYEQTGYKPFLYRFPGGSKNDYNINIRNDLIKEMNRRGFVYFDWNVDSQDALGANWSQMYNTVLSETSEVKRAVILFHDAPGREKTVLVMEDIIKALTDDPKCYTFSAITENTRPMQF